MASEYKHDKPPTYLRWWMFIIYALVVLVVGMRLCTETGGDPPPLTEDQKNNLTRTSTVSSSWPAPSTPTYTKTVMAPAAWIADCQTSRPSSTSHNRHSTDNAAGPDPEDPRHVVP